MPLLHWFCNIQTCKDIYLSQPERLSWLDRGDKSLHMVCSSWHCSRMFLLQSGSWSWPNKGCMKWHQVWHMSRLDKLYSLCSKFQATTELTLQEQCPCQDFPNMYLQSRKQFHSHSIAKMIDYFTLHYSTA